MRLRKLSIIIPIYNEEKYVRKIILKVLKVKTPKLKKELVVINDGSTDNSTNEIKKLERELKKDRSVELIFINKKKNEGKGASLKEGILRSTGEIVIIQDADFEYDPTNYSDLLEPFLKQDADVVYGSRFISQRPHRVLYFWHFIGNFFLTTLSNLLTNLNLTDMETGYKLFRGDLIRKIALNLKSKRFGFEPEVTAKIAKLKKLRLYEVGISYFGRTYEEGKKIGWQDGIKAIWEIFRYNLLD